MRSGREAEKTLFVTDLDGTLLRSDESLSPFTCETINTLVEKDGMLFSYATARSIYTAGALTAGLSARLPAILHNGVFIMDTVTRERLSAELFAAEEVEVLRALFARHGIAPIVYAIIDGRERFSYQAGVMTASAERFLASRQDERKRVVNTAETLYDGQLYYFTCIDAPEKLRPVYEAMREIHACYFAKELYSGEYWLELTVRGATKADAALRLKQRLGCTRLVAFGDGINDLPLFQVSDACYAVENAAEGLKAVATGIIGSNDADGVAKWLLEHRTELTVPDMF